MAHLLERQLPKAGLRFFFHDEKPVDLEHTSELGSPSFPSPSNGWQIRRDLQDELFLQHAQELGCDVLRPAQVRSYRYAPFASAVDVLVGEELRTIGATWLVDATGRRSLVAESMGWREMRLEPCTASSWAHFRGLRAIESLDGVPHRYWSKGAIAPRQDATTHFMGRGYWVWHIPLSDNTVSLGIVYDRRILVHNQRPQEFFEQFLRAHPTLKEITRGASCEGFRHLPHLPFTSTSYGKPGLVLIGDAAAFTDPLFSPGIELICQQVLWLEQLITRQLRTGIFPARFWRGYENAFRRGVDTRLKLYEKKYFLMGDYKLFSLITQMELAAYFTFHIFPAVLFPALLRFFPRFDRLTSFVYSAVTARFLRHEQRRRVSGRVHDDNRNGKNFTYVRVPKAPLIFVYGLLLFGLFLVRWARFESRERIAGWRRSRETSADPEPGLT